MVKRDLFNLDGRVALVTGGTSGIGRSMAQALWEHGCELIITSLPGSDLDEAVTFIKSANEDLDSDSVDDGPQISFFEVDFLKVPINDVEEQIFAKALTLSSTGVIDIVIANAGMANEYALETITDAQFDEVIHVNMNIPMKLTRVFAKFLIENELKGKVLMTASIAGLFGLAKSTNYCVTKAALVQFARCCAAEWGDKNIYVNCVAPGFVNTTIIKGFVEDDAKSQAILSRVPMKRYGDPSDFKGVALFLCSDASDFVCGETVVVDGGWRAN